MVLNCCCRLEEHHEWDDSLLCDDNEQSGTHTLVFYVSKYSLYFNITLVETFYWLSITFIDCVLQNHYR